MTLYQDIEVSNMLKYDVYLRLRRNNQWVKITIPADSPSEAGDIALLNTNEDICSLKVYKAGSDIMWLGKNFR